TFSFVSSRRRHTRAKRDWSLDVCSADLAARQAFAGWAARPLSEREAVVRRFAETVADHAEELARTIAKETGKPLWETRGEAAAKIGRAACRDGVDVLSAAEQLSGRGEKD